MPVNHFHDDRPITEHDEDCLGYTQPAKHIAKAILNLSSPEGFVLGLEGEWGSGKTSFVNLIIESLQSHCKPPEIVKFSPWLISTRSALLGELFQSVAVAALKIPLLEASEEPLEPTLINRLLSKTPLKRDGNKRDLSKVLNSFGNHISKLSKLAEVAELFGLPYAGIAGKTLQAGSEAISSRATPTLDKEKENLQSELRKLSRKIVVFVDDLDRLEPNEAIEIVRLVRAVVDFPNVVYVLCYSRQILVQSLGQALSLSDGEKYLDKIVQVTFSVPKPEEFDLRRMFKQKIEELFPRLLRSHNDSDPNQMLQRLNEVIDYEGGRTLSTPRDIARAINALQLYAAPIVDKIDLADMTWLQLIRIRNHKFYGWIEEYMNTVSVLVNGATLAGHGRQKIKNDLDSIIDAEQADRESVMHLLTDMLPGIKDRYIEKEGNDRWAFFHELTRSSVASFIQDGRLGSPQHFRYYFALSKPSGAIDDEEFQRFLKNAENNVKDAIQHFSTLSDKKRPQGGVWSEAIVDRLIDVGIEKVSEKSISGVLLSFASAMDKVALNTGVGDWGKYWVWDTAASIMRSGLKRLSSRERSELIYSAFAEGEALGWLTHILRDETFAHGLAGNRQKDEASRILTTEEFGNVAATMRARYKKMSPEILMKTPHFINVLYGWLQLGDEEDKEVKGWVKSVLSTDQGLVTLMENMRGWSCINGHVVHPLSTKNVDIFCDMETVDKRLNDIAQREHGPLSHQAKTLLQAMELSRN